MKGGYCRGVKGGYCRGVKGGYCRGGRVQDRKVTPCWGEGVIP